MSAIEGESSSQKAARLRREKREQKILAAGADRLHRIASGSGRGKDLQETSASHVDAANDPANVDLSVKSSTSNPVKNFLPATTSESTVETTLHSQLRTVSKRAEYQGGDSDSDALARIMQQYFSSPPSGSQMSTNQGTLQLEESKILPDAFASLFNEAATSGGSTPSRSSNGATWRIIHAICSISLGIHLISVLPFHGSRAERLSLLTESTQSIFWVFATMELLLQGTRYVLDQGKIRQAGAIGHVASILPEPYKGYLLLTLTYSGIWTTLTQDAMIIVFMMGAVAWSKGTLDQ